MLIHCVWCQPQMVNVLYIDDKFPEHIELSLCQIKITIKSGK